MERNAVAAFLLMLRNLLQGHAVNQESLVQCQGPAIIGALLCKVSLLGPERGRLPCLTRGTGRGTKMLLVRENFLGEVALEWALKGWAGFG